MIIVKEILNYWFGGAVDDVQVLQEKGKLWFGKDEQVDAEISHRFGAQVVCASRLGLIAGPQPVEQRYLATILLLDQFTRNIYRSDPRSFASDSDALRLALETLSLGYEQRLRPIERVFVYLPLEHSEEIEMQDRSVELFISLKEEVPEVCRTAFAGFLDYALRHQEIIARFGRFPHRNKILRRESTVAEEEFLKQPNSSF